MYCSTFVLLSDRDGVAPLDNCKLYLDKMSRISPSAVNISRICTSFCQTIVCEGALDQSHPAAYLNVNQQDREGYKMEETQHLNLRLEG